MSQSQDQLLNELLAVMWRYAQESEITIMETVEAAHRAAEIVVKTALDAKDGE